MLSIIVGGGIAHVISIFMAVIIGSFATKMCSEKWMNLIAGMLFVSFALKEIYTVLTDV